MHISFTSAALRSLAIVDCLISGSTAAFDGDGILSIGQRVVKLDAMRIC